MRRLLIFTIVLSLVPLAMAKVEFRKTPNTVTITGGSGAKAWHLTYGHTAELNSQLLELSPERAAFAQGGWVRLIDTTQGTVLGRWHVGVQVVNLRPAGEEQVELEVADKDFHCKPYAAAGECPELHDSVLVGSGVRVPLLQGEDAAFLQDVGQVECTKQFSDLGSGWNDLTPERARELLPQAHDLVRGDPYLPWARLVYAHLLLQAGDAGAACAFADVLNSPGGDFTEWLPISAWLDEHHQDAVARAAYDRGYKDFLARGYDPRVFLSQGYRQLLSTPTDAALINLPSEQMERVYRLAPYTVLWRIWQQYADRMQQQGRASEAELWRARARDARQKAPRLDAGFRGRWYLWLTLTFLALLAFLAMILWPHRSQTPERTEAEAGRRRWNLPPFPNLRYWSRRQRLILLLIAVTGWCAMGVAGVYAAAFTRSAFAPAAIRNGNYAGQNARWHLQRLPGGPERDLLLGIAYQQGGDSRRAEETYRKLPQFAESWNNLGVLLTRRHRSEEARQAFQRALQLDPHLPEAAFNLNGSTPDLWTAIHRQYLPEKPMLAVARGAQLRAAYIGGPGISFYLWSAARGPFWPGDAYYAPAAYLPGMRHSDRGIRTTAEAIGIVILLFSIVMVCRRGKPRPESAAAAEAR